MRYLFFLLAITVLTSSQAQNDLILLKEKGVIVPSNYVFDEEEIQHLMNFDFEKYRDKRSIVIIRLEGITDIQLLSSRRIENDLQETSLSKGKKQEFLKKVKIVNEECILPWNRRDIPTIKIYTINIY